jgi:hypothetical protein
VIIPTHPCPGGCGRELVVTQFACGPCWRRLPYRLRIAIQHPTRGPEPLTLRLRAAREWFADNPPPPDRTPPHQLRGATGQYVTAQHASGQYASAGRA